MNMSCAAPKFIVMSQTGKQKKRIRTLAAQLDFGRQGRPHTVLFLLSSSKRSWIRPSKKRTAEGTAEQARADLLCCRDGGQPKTFFSSRQAVKLKLRNHKQKLGTLLQGHYQRYYGDHVCEGYLPCHTVAANA